MLDFQLSSNICVNPELHCVCTEWYLFCRCLFQVSIRGYDRSSMYMAGTAEFLVVGNFSVASYNGS